MELELVYDKQDAIPAGFEGLYTERGGKWHLTGVKGIQTQQNIDNLQLALNKERELKKAAEAAARKFAKLPADVDIDDLLEAVEKVAELTTQLEEAQKGKGANEETIQRRLDAAVGRERKIWEKKLGELQTQHDSEKKRAESLDGEIRTGSIEAALQKAAVEAKMRPEAIADVLLHANLFEVHVDEVTKKKRIVTRDNIGVVPSETPDTWLVGMKEKRPHWWPESAGGGARGSGAAGVGANPFAKGSMNMTLAAALKQKDSAKADAYAKAAGFDSAQHAFDTASW
jgi:hypothetical protein